jgi:hypothetical protein
MPTRQAFLRSIPMFAATLLMAPRRAAAAINHPDPREGIDGADVLTAEQLSVFPDSVVEIYDMVREIPHIADGIGCGCGCAALPNYRSLLTCYHAGGMAMGCAICQGEARLAYRRHKEGQSLTQIRRAIDARWG